MTDIVEKDYAALGHFAESTGKFWWESGHWVAEPPTDMVVEKALAAKDAEIEALRAEVERLTRERDIAVGERVARAKTMRKVRDAISDIRDRVEDEGDRVYFGSTNDADYFRELAQELEDWQWRDILRDTQKSDPFEASRKAHERADKAEAANARMLEALDKALKQASEAVVNGTEHDKQVALERIAFDLPRVLSSSAALQGDGS